MKRLARDLVGDWGTGMIPVWRVLTLLQPEPCNLGSRALPEVPKGP